MYIGHEKGIKVKSGIRFGCLSNCLLYFCSLIIQVYNSLFINATISQGRRGLH